MRSGIRVALELSFGHLMSHREQRSVAKQVWKAYSSNRHSFAPLDLHLTGLAQGAKQLDLLQPKAAHWPAWRLPQHTASARDVWPTSEIVWLSPDATEPLLTLEPHSVYVVGGIVDPHIQPGLTLERAQVEGAHARRLPLPEFAPHSSHYVLSLTSTVELLASINAGFDWQEAIQRSQPTWFESCHSRSKAKSRRKHARKALWKADQ